MFFYNNFLTFHNILHTVCQPIKEENVKIPVPDFFQHALQEGEIKKHRIIHVKSEQSKSCTIIVLLFRRWVSYSGLSSVVFIQDVEGDLLGDSPQQTG